MQIDWTFDGCDSEDEREIARLWEEFQPELEARLAGLPADPSELRLAVLHDSDSDEWNVQAAVHLSTRTLAVERTAPGIRQAFDRVVAALARAVDREEDAPTEVSRRRQGLEAVLPLLERNHTEGRSRTFFTFLRPLLRSLRTAARRELEVLNLEGTLSSEELDVADVLDEVLLRAWERFDDRPANRPLDLWLIDLMHSVLEDYARGVIPDSIDEERPVALPEEDEQSSPHTWVEQATYPESVELSDLLPGHPGVDSWDRLDLETRETRLAELLSYLPRRQRQTLVLAAVEGFDPEEIADIQDRPVEEVNQDIESGRATLQEALAEKL